MAEIKMVTDELEVLAKQFLWGNNILSKQIKAIDNYNNELRNNFAAFSMNKIYNMVEEANIEGYKLLGKLKELHDKLIKVKGDFEKADNENSAQYSSNDSDSLSFTVKKDSGLMRLKKERDNLRDKLFNKDNVFDGTLDFFKLAGIDWKIRFGLFNSSEKNAMIATGINPNLAEAGSDMVTCELGGVFLGSGIAGARSTFKCFKPGISIGGKSFIAASGFGSAGSTSIKNVYESIKKAPEYPDGFKDVVNGMKKVNIKNGSVLEELRKVEHGQWKKVYKDGYDAVGKKVSIHYFQSQSGKVFNVKVKNGWSNK
ncbi:MULTISPECIES: hypothetical protein [Clostridium]|uniref:hypothetical protein n=1 Tax=Clostridium TaxID=1485 RepID=UPI0008258E32|nr:MULTISPECIES: hypothetical protein [Clostridium]PJI06563.1 hypothetical protein CUB90_01195 [Clostridium sp. CT7]